jgi:hypothetical protein
LVHGCSISCTACTNWARGTSTWAGRSRRHASFDSISWASCAPR